MGAQPSSPWPWGQIGFQTSHPGAAEGQGGAGRGRSRWPPPASEGPFWDPGRGWALSGRLPLRWVAQRLFLRVH